MHNLLISNDWNPIIWTSSPRNRTNRVRKFIMLQPVYKLSTYLDVKSPESGVRVSIKNCRLLIGTNFVLQRNQLRRYA